MVRNRTISNETTTTTGSTSPKNDTDVSRTGNDTNYYVAQKERPVRSQTLSPSISPLEQQQQQGQSIINVSDQLLNNSNQPTTDGLLVVNASESDSYYPCPYTNENVSTSTTVVFDNEGGMMNISTSRPPINNYNSNNSDIHGWGELFLFLCWSVTILFCCVLPTFILFARKARQDQRQPPAVRGMLLRTTTTNNNNNNNTSSSTRLTLRQHLFVNSPGWKRYVKSVLFDAWKDTKVVVCKEHFCDTTTNHKTSPTRRKTEPASSSSSPLKSVLCAAAKITSAAQPQDNKKKPYKKIIEHEDEECCGCSIASNDTFQTAVTNTYINDDDDEDDDLSVVSKSGLFLNIPILKSRRAKQGRKIPNSCAICLDSYEIGDTIVWSTSSDSSSSSSTDNNNNKCLHAFHEHCISAWCLRKIEENFSSSNSQCNISVPCPCCRQSFVNFHLDLDHAAANHRSRDDGDSQTEATIIFRQRDSFEI